MNRSEILDTLNEILVEVLEHDDFNLTETTRLFDIDGWDSLAHMLIISSLEEQLDIKFKMKELTDILTVKELIDVIEPKLD